MVAPRCNIEFFQETGLKAVVGASRAREKFGNKILRCYLDNNYKVVPVNKRTIEIEGVPCETNLSTVVEKCLSGVYGDEMRDAKLIGVSIITPPGI